MPVLARTVVIPADGDVFLQWQTAEPSDALDYVLDATAAIPGDLIETLSVSIFPSGAGEMAVSAVSAVLNVATVNTYGGVAGRLYSIRVDATTQLGRFYSWVVYLPVMDPRSNIAPPPAPVADFSAATVWVYSGPARPLPTVLVLPTNPWPLTDDARLITIPPNGKVYLQWPVAEISDFLDYKLNVTAPVVQNGDEISSVLLSIAPYGAGELTTSNLRADGGVIKANLSQGLSGRLYRVKIDVNTLLGRDFSWTVNLPVNADYSIYSVNPPTDTGFGPTSQWALMVLENSQGFWRLEDDLGDWAWG